MRTFRNPQGDGGTHVLIDTQQDGQTVRVTLAPGETATVEFPDWQPCPDILEEVDASRPTRNPQGPPAQAPGVVDTPAPEPTPAEESA